MNATLGIQSMSLAPGSWLDRYELLAMIAEGGFGQVWLARLQGKRGFEKLVAIKVPRLTGDVNFQEMLLDEATIASAIDHENVVRIIELGEQGEILYIVMEWIDGEPLSSLLRTLDKKRVPLPLAISLRIVSETCAAAHAAHELRGPDGAQLGVVHRDISPQNILLTATGRVKLIDFGIVKAKDRAIGETTDGTLKGKIKYMAPEQAFGKMVDRRTDVFALGAVLFRLLVGHAPYESENEVATLHLLNTGAVSPIPDHVPGPVRAVIEKALARSPDARFATAHDMAQALAEAMATLDEKIEPPAVAAFLDQHLHDRIATRRQAVESALKAAAERSAIQKRDQALARIAQDTPPGESSHPSRTGPSRSLVAPRSAQGSPPPAAEPTSQPRLAAEDAPQKQKPYFIAAVSFGLSLLGTTLIALSMHSRSVSNEPLATDPPVATASIAPAAASIAPAAASNVPAVQASAATPDEPTIELPDTPAERAAPKQAVVPPASAPRPAVTAAPAAPVKAKPSGGPAPAATPDFGY